MIPLMRRVPWTHRCGRHFFSRGCGVRGVRERSCRTNLGRPPLQAMKAMSEVTEDPSKLENWRHKPALYALLKKLVGR